MSEAPPALDLRSDVDEWGRSERARALLRRIYDPVYRRWFRAEWEGLEHVPAEGGALLVANHAGAIPADAAVIMHGLETELGRPVYGLSDFVLREMPVVSVAWARWGGVAGHPDNAYRLLAGKRALVLVFPEGTRATQKPFSERYQLRRFGRGGFVEIAMRAGVPVVPITVVGSEEAMPTLATAPGLARLLGVPYVPFTANMALLGPLGVVTWFPSKFKLRVLEPYTFPGVVPDQKSYPRGQVLEAAEEIRGRMQESLDEMLAHRRSVWQG